MNFIENHWLLKKLRFKSWVFVVFQGRLGAGDSIGIWYNLGIIFEKLCLPPMICPWPRWSACDRPYFYRGPRWKCAKKFCTCKNFSNRASRGRPAPARGSPGAGAARAAQVCLKITDLLKKIRFKSWVFVVFQGRRAISKRRGTLPLGNFDHSAFSWVNFVFL